MALLISEKAIDSKPSSILLGEVGQEFKGNKDAVSFAIRKIAENSSRLMQSDSSLANLTIIQLMQKVIESVNRLKIGIRRANAKDTDRVFDEFVKTCEFSKLELDNLEAFFYHCFSFLDSFFETMTSNLAKRIEDPTYQLSPDEKVDLSIFIQQVTFLLLDAKFYKQGQYASVASSLMQFIDIFVEERAGKERSHSGRSHLHGVMNGIKAQVAVVSALVEYGYTVLLPDALKRKEVEAWDTLGSVDAIVVDSEGNFGLIDVMGKILWEGPGTQDISPDDQDRINKYYWRLSRGLGGEKPVVHNSTFFLDQHYKILSTLAQNVDFQKLVAAQPSLRKFHERIKKQIPRFQWQVFTVSTDTRSLSSTGQLKQSGHKDEIVKLAQKIFGLSKMDKK